MSNSIAKTSCLSTRSFKLLKDSMLQAEGLPLAEVLDDNDWQKVFDKHEIDFGHDEDTVYTRMALSYAKLPFSISRFASFLGFIRRS